jgi:cell wall-associated NlpC family hydrolase
VASRSLRRVRPLVLAAALAAGTAVAAHPAFATPDNNKPAAAPTIASVQKRLGQLALKNSQLVERYNQARILATKRAAQAAAASKVAARAHQAYEAASAELSRTLTAQYEGGAMSAAGALLSSSSGEAYLDRLDTLDMLSTHTAQVVKQMARVKAEADHSSAVATSLLGQARTLVRQVQSTKVLVQKQIDKYEATLGMLTAASRAQYLHASNPAVSPSTVLKFTSNLAGSSRAQIAVKFAIAQVGKPYVFGAAGPDSYDCSGLTMAAWARAGVSLPHSAADQYNYGTHVPLSALSPGDLIFMYSPIGHVTIYIGHGLMVSAPQSGEDVTIIPVSTFDGSIVGATHLG